MNVPGPKTGLQAAQDLFGPQPKSKLKHNKTRYRLTKEPESLNAKLGTDHTNRQLPLNTPMHLLRILLYRQKTVQDDSSNYTPENKKYTAITFLYKKMPSVNPAGAVSLTQSTHLNNKQSSPLYATITSPPKDETTDPLKSPHKRKSAPTQTVSMAPLAASSTSDSPAIPRPKPPS